jgi:hypothetical protein
MLSWTAGLPGHQPRTAHHAGLPEPSGRYSAASLLEEEEEAGSEHAGQAYTDAGQTWKQASRASSRPAGACSRPASAPPAMRHSNGIPKSLAMASCSGCGCKSYYHAGGPQLLPCRKCGKVGGQRECCWHHLHFALANSSCHAGGELMQVVS